MVTLMLVIYRQFCNSFSVKKHSIRMLLMVRRYGPNNMRARDLNSNKEKKLVKCTIFWDVSSCREIPTVSAYEG